MSTKSREVIYGGRIIGAKIRADGAREAANKAVREADRAAAELWSIQMEAYGGPAQPSPTIGQCINGGYGWLQVKCHRCETEASIPLDAIRRGEIRNKLEAALQALPVYHRGVIVMREVEGMSYEEMAEAMGVSKGTIMSRLFHARQKLQRALAEVYAEEGKPSARSQKP